MNWPAVVIFALTYAAIASRRLSWLPLDRPAAVTVGAVAYVALGVLGPGEALAAVDAETLLLLFSVMGLGALLASDRVFEAMEGWVARRAPSPQALLGWVVWGAGGLAALLTNDAVALLAAPVLLRLVRRRRLPAAPYLLALATAVNTGSVATLVGNPQNMLCGQLGGLSYRSYLALMGPVALLALALNHAWLAWLFRRSLGAAGAEPWEPGPPSPPLPPRARATLAAVLGVAGALLCGLSMAWTAAGGFALLLLLRRRDTRALWSRIDWPLLLFFAGLFIVVAGFERSGATAWFFARFPLASVAQPSPLLLAALFLLGSNVVSNVPFILVVAPAMGSLPAPQLGWELLAMASTFAGNLTLLGSVANIIVSEAGRDEGGLGFWQHLRVGFPLAVVTTVLGTLWVVAVRGGG